MELLCVLAAVAALFCGCAVLTLKCRVPASVAPLTALSAIVAVLTLAAMAGVLYPAAWLLYLLCLAGGVWVAASCRGSTGAAQRLFTPGSVLFWGMALAFTVYFFVRQPMATDFDELSLWATAVKITKVNDSLYATAKLGTPWAATQNPGLPLLAYFFQFFGDYADWKIYVGYDILYFSVFAAVVGAVPWEKWRVAVPMAAVLWCVPFFFTNYNHTIYLTTTYMTSYGDVPAGLVFGGAVAAWLALRQNSAPKWAVLPILALSANIKANTFVLALVAAGLVAVDEWLFADDGDFKAGLLPAPGSALPALPRRWQFTICGMCAMSAGSSAAAPVIPASARRAPRCPPSWSTALKFCWGSRWRAFTPSARHSSALRWPTWATNSGRVTAS